MNALERLKKGNEESLLEGNSIGDLSLNRKKETSENGQHPYAVILTCSDSRVIPEAIFHAGIGDLFVIRVAGNVIGEDTLASIEYGLTHLGAETVLVLGHTHCGAVTAAIQGEAHGYIAKSIQICLTVYNRNAAIYKRSEICVLIQVILCIGRALRNVILQSVGGNGAALALTALR